MHPRRTRPSRGRRSRPEPWVALPPAAPPRRRPRELPRWSRRCARPNPRGLIRPSRGRVDHASLRVVQDARDFGSDLAALEVARAFDDNHRAVGQITHALVLLLARLDHPDLEP